MKQNSFLLYLDYRRHFELLSNAEVGRLIMAIFNYIETGKLPDFSGALGMAFSFIRVNLDIDRRKYNERCEKNKQNGAKGGRPPK